jgi:N-acetylneuraminic acid mutarotase
MAFNLYPDSATSALLGAPANAPLALAAGKRMSHYVPLAALVGPDPSAQGLATTFIRIALSGPPVPDDMQPTIELVAHDPSAGSAATIVDPSTATSPASAVALSDDLHAQAAALAYFLPPYSDNVYPLKVLIEIAGTNLWIRIRNTTGADREVVWVVADSDDDALQPWIQATPAALAFNAMGGLTAAQSVEVVNRGTGPFSVVATNPVVGLPYTVSGLPATLGPNPATPAKVTIGFNSPGIPGDIGPSTFAFVTSDKEDPGPFNSDGHNNQFRLSAHIGNVWVAKTAMPTKRFFLSLAAAASGKLYAVGGTVAVHSHVIHLPFVLVATATVEQYDPLSDVWTVKTEMPTPRSGLGLVAATNGRLYAIGGSVNVRRGVDGPPIFVPSVVVEEYDPATDTWTTKAAMPTGRSALGVAAAANGKIYAVGGTFVQTPGTFPVLAPSAAVEEYDPATNTWTTKAPLSAPRTGLALAAANNGKLYAVGGSTGAKVEEYDPATNTWATRTPPQTARMDLALAAAADGKLYAVGGVPLAGAGPLAAVEAYDLTINAWTTCADLLTARGELALAAAANGRLYAVGGRDASNNASAVVEEYSL